MPQIEITQHLLRKKMLITSKAKINIAISSSKSNHDVVAPQHVKLIKEMRSSPINSFTIITRSL